MLTVNIRDLVHNFSAYLKEVKSGEHITVLDRHVPVADIIPHNENLSYPGWKRKISRIKLKKENEFSKTLLKNRNEER